MKMFNQMLQLHWKAVRWPLAPFVLLAFGLPMLVTRMAQIPRQFGYGTGSVAADIVQMESSLVTLFPILALLIGVTLAMTAWSWDHQGRHVYALSLPVTRGRYALLKLSAGIVLIAAPVAALFAGTVFGLFLTKLPPELHGYPVAFTLRFTLAVLITYAGTFALASSSVRTTAILMLGLVAYIVIGSIVVGIAADVMNTNLRGPAEYLYNAIMRWPGPFSVFGGNWLFIDA